MARGPRVVAELGRPETPDETAARKAEFSRSYRSSQTTRNLIAALLATRVIVASLVCGVPRGEIAPREPIDVEAVAAQISASQERTVVAPDVPAEWIVNRAGIEGDSVRAWTIVYATGEDAGFLRIAQGFDADAAWTTRTLQGADSDGTVTVDGIEWTRYDIADPSRSGNISGALSTVAGSDTILVYGSTGDELLEQAAASLADDVRALREEAR